jgi:hypothetical protein
MERLLNLHCAFELYELLCEKYDISPLAEDSIVSMCETWDFDMKGATAEALGVSSASGSGRLPAEKGSGTTPSAPRQDCLLKALVRRPD